MARKEYNFLTKRHRRRNSVMMPSHNKDTYGGFMTGQVTVELFIIGNEHVIGEIEDTNTHWLCHELHRIGGMVTRVTLLRDELDVIAGELQIALQRGPRVIITSGGLGPTIDDLTLTA